MNYVIDLTNSPTDLAYAMAQSANGDEITLINAMLHVLVQLRDAAEEQVGQLGKEVKVQVGFAFKAKLRSNAQEAAEATDRTLRSIPVWPGFLLRDNVGTGPIMFDSDGNATVISLSRPDYLKQAIVNQGYVSSVALP